MITLIKKTFYNEEETKKLLCEFISNSKKLSMGEKCKEFEKEFSKYQGRKYSVLFNSGGSANLALIQTLLNLKKLKKRDNIGFSALTWSTNVMPLMQLGLNQIPIDVSLENLNVNLEDLKNYTGNIKALFITNVLGYCGDLDKIKEYCKEKGILLIEDNCEALGSELKGEKLGNFGIASTFSFFVGHHLSTIEGGMVCTDDTDIYNMLLMVRAHGWARDLDAISQIELKEKNDIKDFHEKYTFYSLGYNLRPTEITGFLGLEQMKHLKEICFKRKFNFDKYEEAVSKNPNIQKLNLSHMSFISNFGYPIIFKNKWAMEEYKEKFSGKVEVRPLLGGNITQQPFFNGEEYQCLNTEKIHNNGFYIPNNPDLTEEEIKEICELLK